jgi:hypothetical protein
MSVKLILVNVAKSTGGDKYNVAGADWNDKDRFIYVPQSITRQNGSARDVLYMTIDNNDDEVGIIFELIKSGKTGDDRYATKQETKWQGDIYVPQKYRNDNGRISLHISFDNSTTPATQTSSSVSTTDDYSDDDNDGFDWHAVPIPESETTLNKSQQKLKHIIKIKLAAASPKRQQTECEESEETQLITLEEKDKIIADLKAQILTIQKEEQKEESETQSSKEQYGILLIVFMMLLWVYYVNARFGIRTVLKLL